MARQALSEPGGALRGPFGTSLKTFSYIKVQKYLFGINGLKQIDT